MQVIHVNYCCFQPPHPVNIIRISGLKKKTEDGYCDPILIYQGGNKSIDEAIVPYSQGVVTGNFLFTSGQLPIDPATNKIPEGSIENKAHIVFKNLAAIAKEAKTSLDNAVKTTILLLDINDFSAVGNIFLVVKQSVSGVFINFQLNAGADD
jgi:reactive intermediate/imine deaminase